jgi:hypothetical protein
MKWEYLVYDCGGWEEDYIRAWLNERGAEGWELIHVSQALRTYFLKRAI